MSLYFNPPVHSTALHAVLSAFREKCLQPAPKHIIIDKTPDGDYTTKLFSKEQTYKSMLKILGY